MIYIPDDDEREEEEKKKPSLKERILYIVANPTKGQMVAIPLGILGLFLFLLILTIGDMDRFTAYIQNATQETMHSDSKYYGYDDKCNDKDTCRECKAEVRCLGCMHMCYNKWDAYFDDDNPYQEFAQSCVTDCYAKQEERTSSSRGQGVDAKDWKMR